MTDQPQDDAKAKAPASPWQSTETLSNDALLGAIPDNGSIRLPDTNIVIPTTGSVFDPEKVDGIRKSHERKLRKAAIIMDSLQQAEIPSERIANVHAVCLEGQPVSLVDEETETSYTLSPAAESDLLKLTKIDFNTFKNMREPELRASMLNHRIEILSVEVSETLAEKSKKGDISNYSLFLTFNHDEENKRNIVLALRIAPAASLTVEDIYPRQTVQFLQELHEKHDVAIIRLTSNIPFADNPDGFLSVDPDGPAKVDSGKLLTYARQHGSPWISAMSIDNASAFSIFQGDRISPSQTFKTTAPASGTFEKEAEIKHSKTEMSTGLYRYTCSNGMSVMVDQSDLVNTALSKFFTAHPEGTVNLTYKRGGEFHQELLDKNSWGKMVQDVWMPFLGKDCTEIAVQATEDDATLQGLLLEVNRAADTAKKKIEVYNATPSLFHTVMAERRDSDKKHLLDLMQKMQANAQRPIFDGIPTTLSAADLLLHLVSAAKMIGSALGADQTLVRNVCMMLLIKSRKTDMSEIFQLTSWHILNAITLAAHGLNGDKRVDAEAISADWARGIVAAAQEEARLNRAPSAAIAQSFSRLIHEPKRKASVAAAVAAPAAE